jgi:hypothetical protein
MDLFTVLRPRIITAIAPFLLCQLGTADLWAEVIGEATASGSAAGSSPAGAVDGNRFSTDLKSLWKGSAASGYWQCTFPAPRRIGAILQIHGDHPELLQNAPRNYTWHVSNDGEVWTPLLETVVRRETRMYRIHRLSEAVSARHVRLMINLSYGEAPAIREV